MKAAAGRLGGWAHSDALRRQSLVPSLTDCSLRRAIMPPEGANRQWRANGLAAEWR